MVSLRSAACGIAAALATLAALPAAAQSATVVAGAARPKVCLVLSGGGARGAAHIGVLKVLEEYRVPVDCITGTSMGSLVGAAYASGMTVPEMEAFTSRITFDLLFKEAPPREELTVRRKQEDLRFNLFSPDIGVSDRGEVGFAKGVVSGVRLETVLRELSRVKGYVDFDKLPIRYRAVATDLVTGKPKVFDKGDLALAMRASMSVPGIIAPAEFDGMMLVDGGLVNNLPVDIARALGADIVIAVNLGTPLAKAEAITNVLGITGQMIAILTEQNVQATLATLKPTDILILPELGTYSAGDFDNMRTTFPIGEAAARKVADRLAALSLPAEQYAEFQARRTQTTLASALPIDEVRFEPTRARVNPEYLGTLIETQAGEPLDQAKLDRDLLRLYGTEDFEHVSYRLIESPTRRILNIQGVEKSWGPNYLRFGLGLTTDFSGDAFFNLQGRYRRTWLNSYGGEWYTDLSIGRNTALYSEFYQPVDAKQRFFVAPYLDVERRYIDVFVGNDPLSEYALPSAVVGVDVGGQLSRYGELRVGLFGGITRPDLNSGPRLLADEKSATLAGVRLRAYLDQLDSANFPKRGYAAQLDLISGLEALGSDTSYDRWDFNAIAAFTVGRHTVQVGAKGTGPITQDRAGLSYVAQPWGGFLQQSGFRTGQLLNERFVYGRVQYSYRALTVPLFEGLYVGAAGEIGNYGAPLVAGNPTGTLYSGSAYVALDSPIGPMYLGYGVGSGGNNAAYFFLGRP